MSMSKVVRCTCRLHLDHTYGVEECQCSTIPKSVSIDVSKIGIIGHDKAIEEIMWSVFKLRQLSKKTIREFNIHFPCGIILYGPSGTGKTSLIRGICEYMHIQPHIVRGSEVLQKHIGNPALAIQELFDKAICDHYKFGDESPLHVIVISEMEVLFPRPSSSSDETNTRNVVVRQMRTIMNGYIQYNNFVVFGTTNRLDMIDSGLLCNGRFCQKIKIDLPDVKARFEILKFHIDRLQNNARLASDVTETMLAMIAESTMGYSGANLKQIVQKAILLGIQRVSMASEMDINGKRAVDESRAMINLNDITWAYQTFEQERRMAKRQNIE